MRGVTRPEVVRNEMMRPVTLRVGPTLQPVGIRTASIVVPRTDSPIGVLGVKVQALLEQTLRLARAAYNEQLANVFVAFLTPASVVALVLGLWRVTADVGWTGEFLISDGFFSHWQVWIALAIALKFLATLGSASPKVSEEN
jgi:hypothetical protein